MIHRGLIALAALLSPTGLQAQDAPLPKLPIEAYTLPNGLKVVLHRDPSIPRASRASPIMWGPRTKAPAALDSPTSSNI
jgi:hypothetical protein